MSKKVCLLLGFVYCFLAGNAQLKAGFDRDEYITMLRVTEQFRDSVRAINSFRYGGFKMVYQSPALGLDNKWQLWKGDKGTAIISIRGTTSSQVSWLANFYAAMIPAKGELQLSKDYKFSYQLSSHSRAAVHVGWTVALGFLVKDMKPKLDSLLQSGTKDIVIVGHSQGGAISYLLTAYLRQQQIKNEFPKDVRIKTYCSAAPKPGNSYFAYEYEALTQGGWAFNVVNAADWVPQTPFSAQGLNDFNEINPFVNAKKVIKKQKWPMRWGYNYAYGKMKKPAKKALKTYEKFLGDFVSKAVKKSLDGFEAPDYYPSTDYVRTGDCIVLYPDEEYYKAYPQDKSRAFVNHGFSPYFFLALKLNMDGSMRSSQVLLGGKWELNYLSGTSVEELYKDKKPELNFYAANSKMNGNTGCNDVSGTYRLDGNHIFFNDNLIMTKMFCEGEGEKTFLDMLKKVNAYSANLTTLTFLIGDVAVMRFDRK